MLFFATDNEVGYCNKPGFGFTFLSGIKAKIKIHEDFLYLFSPDLGVVRCSPASDLTGMARDLNYKLD